MKKILLGFCVLAALAACGKEDNKGGNGSSQSNSFKEGQEVTISGSIAAVTKASGVAHEDGSVDFVWRDGDAVTVSVGSATSEFKLSSGAGKAQGKFTGKMPAAGDKFSVSFGPTTVPSEQDFVLGGLNANLVKASGEGTVKGGFSLEPKNAVLRFDLYGSNIEVKSLAVKTPEGDYTISIADGTVLGNSEFDLTPFFVVTGAGSGKFAITVKDLDGKDICTIEPEQQYTLEVGKVLYLGALEVVAAVDVHEAVDLGLPSGTKWAKTNVGAGTPFQFGDYVAWGETEPYYTTMVPEFVWKAGHTDGYTLISYCGVETTKMVEWDPAPYEDDPDTEGMYRLKAAYDYAKAAWGEEWSIPTKAQFQELYNNCTWEIITSGVASTNLPSFVSTVDGMIIFKGKESKLDTSTYIFLPRAGNIKDKALRTPMEFGYWTSNLYEVASSHMSAWICYEKNGTITAGTNYRSRFFGVPVRAVTK